jgi:hypothetical protein
MDIDPTEYASLIRDRDRLDWLADIRSCGEVALPSPCVEQNIHSMRDAIDMAMEQYPLEGQE